MDGGIRKPRRALLKAQLLDGVLRDLHVSPRGLEEGDRVVVSSFDTPGRLAVEGSLEHQMDLASHLVGDEREREDEHSLFLQARACVTESFDGIDERIEPNARGMAEQRMGIEQAIHDHVVVPVAVPSETSARR